MVRSDCSASSNARIEPGRPILNATFVNGKMTTSRIGTIGRRAMSVGVWSEYSSIKLNDSASSCSPHATVQGGETLPLSDKLDFRRFQTNAPLKTVFSFRFSV